MHCLQIAVNLYKDTFGTKWKERKFLCLWTSLMYNQRFHGLLLLASIIMSFLMLSVRFGILFLDFKKRVSIWNRIRVFVARYLRISSLLNFMSIYDIWSKLDVLSLFLLSFNDKISSHLSIQSLVVWSIFLRGHNWIYILP